MSTPATCNTAAAEPAAPGRSRMPLADRVHDRLKADIFDFRLMPGDRLSENEIAARVGASRTPVREALFRLQREGYVETPAGGGWQVRRFDFARFDELYEVRVVIESAAVRRLCARAERPAALAELEAVWQVPTARRTTDSTRAWHLDEQFHAGLVAAAGNDEMARMHRDVTERIRVIRPLDFTVSARIAATYDEHAAILAALADRRAAAAQRLLAAHIEASRREVRKITLEGLYEARAALADTPA